MASSRAQALTGAGGTATNALASIGSDLSVSVSFQVAIELVDASREVQMQDAELIGIVLGLSVVFSALLSLLTFRREENKKSSLLTTESRARKEAAKDGVVAPDAVERYVKQCVALEDKRFEEERSLTDFSILLVQISARISFSLTVQLLATSARSRQSSRVVRVLSLIGLSIFFTWIHASADKRIF
jgi:hypothetical protein